MTSYTFFITIPDGSGCGTVGDYVGQSVKDSVGEGNYTYYTLKQPGDLELVLTTLEGKANLSATLISFIERGQIMSFSTFVAVLWIRIRIGAFWIRIRIPNTDPDPYM